MPHIKMTIIEAVREANGKLARADPEVIAAATTLGGLAAALEMSTGSQTAVGRLYDESQGVVLAAIQQAFVKGRPVYLKWDHGAIQRVEVTPPSSAAPGQPLDIKILTRYDDDGLGPNSTS